MQGSHDCLCDLKEKYKLKEKKEIQQNQEISSLKNEIFQIKNKPKKSYKYETDYWGKRTRVY